MRSVRFHECKWFNGTDPVISTTNRDSLQSLRTRQSKDPCLTYTRAQSEESVIDIKAQTASRLNTCNVVGEVVINVLDILCFTSAPRCDNCIRCALHETDNLGTMKLFPLRFRFASASRRSQYSPSFHNLNPLLYLAIPVCCCCGGGCCCCACCCC